MARTGFRWTLLPALLTTTLAMPGRTETAGAGSLRDAPEPAAQRESAEKIRKLFAAEYSSRDPAALRGLAAKLAATAESTLQVHCRGSDSFGQGVWLDPRLVR